MNILYCGDRNIEDGLIISAVSLAQNAAEPLHIYVMTMALRTENRSFQAVRQETIDYLNDYLRKYNSENVIELLDATSVFSKTKPDANIETRFTPFCMLRLYADLMPEIPDKILYLDNDVICRKNPASLYNTDLTGCEMAGVLDYYGRWFFHSSLRPMDYLNSGVLLLNMKEIRRTGLFEKSRIMCRDEKMFMPDQSALNKLCKTKVFLNRKYNDQRRLHNDTVMQHFTTSFRAFPWIHTVSVKPWQIEKMHSILKLHEYDNLLLEYTNIRKEII